jgi:DNA-binding NarL/FixJ family response regulator
MKNDDGEKNILLISDHQVDIRKIEKRMLDFSGMPCRLYRATTISAIKEMLGKRGIAAHVIIFDLRLQGIGEPETEYQIIKSVAPDTPVVLLSGEEEEACALANRVMAAGAVAHIHREKFDMLMSILRTWMYRERGE